MSDNISSISEELRDKANELGEALHEDVDDACNTIENTAQELRQLAETLDRMANSLSDAKGILS